jgi:hypothetical protein
MEDPFCCRSPKKRSKKKIVPARTKRVPWSSAVPRTAQEVIDQAINENKASEYLLYGFAIAFVFCGMIALVAGAIQNERLVALAGGIGSALFYPSMRLAKQIRRENIAIRLGELPLSKAETSHEASIALKEFFVDTFRSQEVDT